MKYLWVLFVFISSSCLAAIEKLPHCNSVEALKCAKKYLPFSPVVLECGGYDGVDTLMMSQLWPNGKIYTFEPVPELFERLRNRNKSQLNVFPFQIALGDFCGNAVFYISTFQGEISASSSLLPPKEHTETFQDIIFEKTIEVPVTRLDIWAAQNKIGHLDLMWLDMQGYELNILKDSQLAKNAKVIYLEVEFRELYEGQYLFKDIHSWMTNNGFKLMAVDFDPNIDHYFGNAMYVRL